MQPHDELETTFNQLNLQEATLAYDESLVAVRLLVQRIGTGVGLLLQDLGEGQPLDQALQRFGLTSATLEAQVMQSTHAANR